MPTTTTQKGFLSQKELAAKYGVNRKTFSPYLQRGLPLLYAFKILNRKGPKLFTPAEIEIIYKKLGKPTQE